MKDPNKVREVIEEKIDLAKVMLDYGVQFTFDPLLADEVQYRCPFHGADNKPSSRFYRGTNSCYCWVCKKRWDVTDFIMDKEKLGYVRAINFIVNKYKVDVSSVPDGPDFTIKKQTVDFTEMDLKIIRNKILDFRGKLPLNKYAALCTAYYMTLFSHSKGDDVGKNIDAMKAKLSEIAI